MPLPTQIQLSNTFGQWVNATNAIITALGNTSEYILVTQTASPAPSTGNVSINGTMTVVNVTANGVLTVFANSSLNGAVTLHNTASIVGAANALSTLGVTGTFTALNQLVVGANANFDSGTLFVDAVNNRVGVGNTGPTHALRVQGTASINGAFTADTTTSLGGAVNALSTLGVSGAVNALSTVGISGAANALSTLGVTGAVNALSTVGISGAVNALSTLGVAGAVNALSTLGITGATNALSTLGITGAVNALSTLGVSGIFTAAANSTLTGAVTMSNALAVTGNVTFSNTLAVTGNVTFSNTLAVTGNVTFSNTLAVTGNVTFSNTLAVTGNATFSRDVTISGNLTISGTTTYINTTTLNIGDNIITLNADLPGASAPTENAGFEINRGSSANVALRWNETTDKWDLTSDGTTYVNVATIDITSNASNITSGSLSYSRLATTTTGRILIANTLGNIEALAMSGDISIDGTGATTIGAGKVTSSMILDGTIVNADINGSAAIAHSKLASITAGHLLMGNAASGAEALAMSGDVTISSAGVTTIGAGKVTSGMILDGTIVNADISGAAAITYNKLATATAGTLLMANATSNVEAIAMQGDVTINSSGFTTIGTGKVTSAMILNDTIANTDISPTASIQYSKLALTGSITNADLAGSIALTKLTSDTSTALGVGTLELGHASDTTLSRSSAGVLAVEGVVVPTISSTHTLTNKTLTDSTTYFADDADTTKKMQFQLSGITTATTRTLTIPDVNGTIITSGDSGTVTSTMILNGTIVDADISGAAAITYNKLATATAGRLLMANATGNVEAIAMQGDVTISSAGVTTIGAGKVTSGMILDGTIANTDINDSANIARTKISGTAVTEGTASTITAKVAFSGTGRLVLPVGTNLWAT